MWILDNIRGFLKIWTREATKKVTPTQPSVDVDAIDFTRSNNNIWTGYLDFKIPEFINTTIKSETKTEDPKEWNFRQKISESWNTEWNNALYDEIKKDLNKFNWENLNDAVYNMVSWFWEWLWKLAEVTIPETIKWIRGSIWQKKDESKIFSDLIKDLWLWDRNVYNFINTDDEYTEFDWKIKDNAVSIFNDWSNNKDIDKIQKKDIDELKNKYKEGWFSNNYINKIDYSFIKNSKNINEWPLYWVVNIADKTFEFDYNNLDKSTKNEFETRINNSISELSKSEDITLDNLKSILKKNWAKDEFLNAITQDSFERSLIKFDKNITNLQNKISENLIWWINATIVNEFYDLVWPDKDKAKMLSIYLENKDISNIKKEELVSDLKSIWLRELWIINIDDLKDRHDKWKLDNNIIEVSINWDITKEEDWYKIKIDNDGNIIEKIELEDKEFWDFSLKEKELVKLWLDNQSWSDVKKEVLKYIEVGIWDKWVDDEKTVIYNNITSSLFKEINTQLDHVKWNYDNYLKESTQWNSKLAEELEEWLRELINLQNNHKRNLMELAKIKVENQFSKDKEISHHASQEDLMLMIKIENHYHWLILWEEMKMEIL